MSKKTNGQTIKINLSFSFVTPMLKFKLMGIKINKLQQSYGLALI